ncbi:MAG: aldo/keto reductase [Gammaproteobacteria bacterium]|nr:aldo/keto reductase [Gammaproteobacteria bacterium]
MPGADIALPVIGLGNSQAFRTEDQETSNKLLSIFRKFGGSFIDAGYSTGPFLSALSRHGGFRDELFLGYYMNIPVERPSDQPPETHSIQAQARALVEANGGQALELVQSADLAGYAAHADDYAALKTAGLTRFIGVARHQQQYHADMVRLIEAGKVDFVQVNYSMLEPEAAATVLPAAQAHGVGIIINRPFVNGEWFSLVKGRELPAWAAQFDCDSWAQFSLKYILSHPAVTCVLTETAKEHHARDNLSGGLGRLPDPETRQRMKSLVDSFT